MPLSRLRTYSRAEFEGTLIGATDSLLERMGPSPKPGVLKLWNTFGLLLERNGGRDTLFPEDWPSLHPHSLVCSGLQACLDSLDASPVHGLLQGPFLPRISFPLGKENLWIKEGDSLRKPPRWDGSASLSVLVKPSPRARSQGDWILALADFPPEEDTVRRAWIWRTGRGPAQGVRLPAGDPFEVVSAQAQDLDRDGHPDLIAKTVSYYGDGSYADLHLLHGNPDSLRPGYASVSLAGSSGEPGGSTVAGDWWTAPPWIYVVSAVVGNDNAPEESRDLHIEAYAYGRDGALTRSKSKAFPAAVFGEPAARGAADSLARMLAGADGEAGPVFRALPRLVKGRILWQAGALAPDEATAKRWARRDTAGKAVRFPAL